MSISDRFWKMLSSSTEVSFGRSGCMFIIYFLIMWSTYIVSATKMIPNVPDFWKWVIGILYLGTAGKDIANKYKESTSGILPGN